jgi:hemolysin activation/secretion protein
MFGFGGTQFGRGFDASELIGDSGVAGKLELRYTDTLPTTPSLTYTAYAFWDAGKVWRRNPINEEQSESGTSFGVGLRLDVARNVTGFGELAKPATRNVRAEGDRDTRGYVGLAYRF